MSACYDPLGLVSRSALADLTTGASGDKLTIELRDVFVQSVRLDGDSCNCEVSQFKPMYVFGDANDSTVNQISNTLTAALRAGIKCLPNPEGVSEDSVSLVC
jgi:hypothetical protein